jgi:hypothetical protein
MLPNITQSGALFLAHHKEKILGQAQPQTFAQRIRKMTVKRIRRRTLRARYAYRDDGR